MLVIRCKECNKELVSNDSKSQCCGCPNMATIKGDKISAVDLTRIVMINSYGKSKKNNVLSAEDIAWQEARRQRKVKRLDFEVR